MSSFLNWEKVALNTYIEEINFILLKWNNKEVQNFKDLVDENLERLIKNPKIGVLIKKKQFLFLDDFKTNNALL